MSEPHPAYGKLFAGALAHLTVVSIFLFTGCTDAERRIELKGEITLDGEPLENATLILTPKGQGKAVAATIEAGKFHLAKDLGPTLGEYHVQINPLDGDDNPESFIAHSKAVKKKQFIPKAYQSGGTLTISVTGAPGELFHLELKSASR